MVLLKMLMKIGLPKMRGLLVMTMASLSLSTGEGGFPNRLAPSEGKTAPAQVKDRGCRLEGGGE